MSDSISDKLRMRVLDYIFDLGEVSCYELDFVSISDESNQISVLLQFRLKGVIDQDLPATNFRKFMNKDEFYLLVKGSQKIDWRNLDSDACLESAQLGIREDDGQTGGTNYKSCAINAFLN
ncbi:unnamed protein product [Oikopleura dioica]|uniref:Uncharacterized protein n=1 Tax=Oikopleura dioica TaxID=34765 RepID=E4YQD3_OIKDI|nr:unnamed protein product [Oikopleura dioica]